MLPALQFVPHCRLQIHVPNSAPVQDRTIQAVLHPIVRGVMLDSLSVVVILQVRTVVFRISLWCLLVEVRHLHRVVAIWMLPEVVPVLVVKLHWKLCLVHHLVDKMVMRILLSLLV